MSHPVLLLTSTREEREGTSFVIQWLRLCASNAGGAVLTPGSETKIPHALRAVLSHSVMSDSLQPCGLKPAKLLCPWGFSRQEYWSGLSCPPPGDHPNPGIEPRLTLYCLSHQRDVFLIPGLGRSPGGRQGNLPQYSSLENSMDSGAWWAIVHSIAKNRT